MANTKIKLRPATSADVAEITRIHYAALQPYHEFYGAFFAIHPRILLLETTVQAMTEASCFFIVAEHPDAPGLVGFLRYQIKDPESEVKLRHTNEKSDTKNEVLFAPKDHLESLWEQFQQTEAHMDDCYEKQTPGQRHIYVKHLMVDPSYQLQGIGKVLLKEVVNHGKGAGLPIYITSSRESHNLYLKFGFQDLASRIIDNGEWAKMICNAGQESGLLDNAGLEQTYCGVTEEEHLMVLEPMNIVQSI